MEQKLTDEQINLYSELRKQWKQEESQKSQAPDPEDLLLLKPEQPFDLHNCEDDPRANIQIP